MTRDGAGEVGARAFADLYEPLRRFASVVRSPDMDADDLVQEALVRTLALQPLEELDDPAAYLRTVIVRLAANERRGAGASGARYSGSTAPRKARRLCTRRIWLTSRGWTPDDGTRIEVPDVVTNNIGCYAG